ncbi:MULTISPECIES: endo-1,4-beta-xylanase [Sphingobium]|uniref:Beta-xylanase n=1 Tax=Sphingobium chungbukense TaxID=56193 RepID=A0A0M3AW69_9SPHN|nr:MULTISPECIES: endo-1,4-beta-xylanase [Sphingobium]KKW92809.1 1,4-beta-xylanase [Sphingobium chungbukense]PJG49590.1 1,4-beta-xylanase [Sphingobium sp. LB126]
MKRREFLAGALALGACSPVPSSRAEASISSEGLAAHARRSGRYFGAAIKSRQLREDPDFTAAVARECDMVVQEYELKRGTTEPRPGKYDFSGADQIIAFAQDHGMKARGHALVWYAAQPDWLEPALKQADLTGREKLMTSYIDIAMPRYAGKIGEWDVVNEAIEPNDGRADGMRAKSMWLDALGEDYIDIAFHRAREVDPRPMRFLTDFGLEHDSPRCERRRTAMLKLLDRLMARNVPVDAVGIQGHLKPYKEGFDQAVFARFLEQLSGYGLALSVTEFDVADKGGPPNPDKRDGEIASVAKAFLDVALDNPAMRSVLCWGLSDRYSWLSNYPDYKWSDGQLSRVLPLDGQMRRKPLWDAIASAFDAAPPIGRTASRRTGA